MFEFSMEDDDGKRICILYIYICICVLYISYMDIDIGTCENKYMWNNYE